MADQRSIRPANGPVDAEVTSLPADDVSRRQYRDYERMRAELARLRKDVQRLAALNAGAESPSGDGDDEELEEVEREILSMTARTALWIRHHPVRLVSVLAALAVLIALGPRAWGYLQSYEATDDAQINGHIDPIGSRISGTITHVYVEENQHVNAGAPLAQIDPHGYQIAVERSRAALAEADAEIKQTRQQLDSVAGMIDASEATSVRTKKDAKRYSELLERKVISDQINDQAVEAARVASSTTDSLRAQWAALNAALASRMAGRQAAQAALDQALLNLSYTKIIAPVSGIVGERSVEIGQHVTAGEQLLAIVRDQDLWVTANFKETELARMRAGMPATVHVDAFDRDFRARVESIAGASGAKYSILPPENATGNFVKVVQRIPVRIGLLQGQQEAELLRPGMSVEATVWLRH